MYTAEESLGMFIVCKICLQNSCGMTTVYVTLQYTYMIGQAM